MPLGISAQCNQALKAPKIVYISPKNDESLFWSYQFKLMQETAKQLGINYHFIHLTEDESHRFNVDKNIAELLSPHKDADYILFTFTLEAEKKVLKVLN